MLELCVGGGLGRVPQISKECQVVGQIVSAERRNGSGCITQYGAKSVEKELKYNLYKKWVRAYYCKELLNN